MLNNLGMLLVEQGMSQEAVPLLESALLILQQVHGGMHDLTAIGMDNLSQALYAQGDADSLARASELSIKAQEIWDKLEEEISTDHPDDEEIVRTEEENFFEYLFSSDSNSMCSIM
jgi:hypothetical protein